MELGEAATSCSIVTSVLQIFISFHYMFVRCCVAIDKKKKKNINYGSLNYLVNMTMESNLITGTKRTLLVLQITNQSLGMGRNIYFIQVYPWFSKYKISCF